MKKFILLLFLFVTVMQAGAQKPVTVSHDLTADGSEVLIEFIAEIADGYYMYSTDIPKGGPKPTYLKVTEQEHLQDLLLLHGQRRLRRRTSSLDR